MTTPTDVTEARLRATLAAAAPDDTHVEPGLAELQDRLDGGARIVAIHRPSRRWLGIAAAVVLVLAVGAGAVAVAGRDDGSGRVATHLPEDATGWYIPSGLDGWELQSVQASPLDTGGYGPDCPCGHEVWIDGTGQAVRVERFQGGAAELAGLLDETDPADRIDGIALGGGRTAVGGIESGSTRFVAWEDEGTVTSVSGNGLSDRRVMDAAHAVADAAGPGDPPLPGFRLAGSADVPVALDSFQDVHVTLRSTATGKTVTYVLSPPGYDTADTSAAPTVVDLPGAPGTLLRTRTGATADPTVWYVGNWPGSTVSTGPDAELDDGPSTRSDADVQAVLGSLRPATAADWAAFLDSAATPVRDRGVLAAGSLLDLAAPRAAPAADGTAAALQFRPVLAVGTCEALLGPAPGVLADPTGATCYQVGSVAADGTDLQDAEAADQEDWVVDVSARPDAVERLNALFNACYGDDPTCPAEPGVDRGSVAVVWNGRVVSTPAVNGPDLADDRFTLSGAFDQQAAEELAAAIDAG